MKDKLQLMFSFPGPAPSVHVAANERQGGHNDSYGQGSPEHEEKGMVGAGLD